MPDTPPSTLIHFTTPILLKIGQTACHLDHRTNPVSARHGDVTCFACRKSPPFITRHGVEPPTPPVKLFGVMAAAPELQTLHRAGLAYIVKRGLNSGTNDGEHEALTELADALGLVYDDDTESYT